VAPSSAITSVVFDMGGVLISPITNLIDEIATWHEITMVEMLDVLMGPREESTPDHPWHRAERGELAMAALQREAEPFAEAAGVRLRGDEYERLLRGDFEVHDVVLERIGRLREQGYRTAMLTNSFREFRPVLEERIDVSVFDVVVDSSEVGCRKPEPEIYEVTSRLLGRSGEQILYLDDFAANLVGAEAAGWTTIHVIGVGDALADLDRLLGV
jgi:putative hydrolase of the HAD superfamily